MNDTIKQQYICGNFGHDVRTDACGFLHGDNRIVSCAHCPDHMQAEQLEFDFTKKDDTNGTTSHLDI